MGYFTNYLIELAHEETENPNTMDGSLECHKSYPWVTRKYFDNISRTFSRFAGFLPEGEGAENIESTHYH